MTAFRIPSAALIVSWTALSAAAQSRPADIASAPTTTATSMSRDCAKPIARHDHAAERGMPKTQAAAEPCPPVKAASAPKSKSTHDHAKFHKNQ
jgi:hypothetical protein